VSFAGFRHQLLYLVLDGLGDEPCDALGGQTPLEAARTPQLDELARRGQVCWLDLRDRSGEVTTNRGQFALLGYDDEDATPRRGPVEAVGLGVQLQEGDVALRANFATLDAEGRIVDRRAGRIREGTEELGRAIDGMDLGDGVVARVHGGIEHRMALVLRGPGLSAAISDSDPTHTSAQPTATLDVQPTDAADPAAAHTADKLRSFLARIRPILSEHPVNRERQARGLLPANGLLTRQAGRHVSVQSLEDRFGVRCLAIAGDGTVIGVMRVLGCETVKLPSFTANADTDLDGKLVQAAHGIEAGYGIVMTHIKATDTLSHDRQPVAEVAFLERIDAALATALAKLPPGVLVAVGSDHATSSTIGDHLDIPTPALLSGVDVPASGAAAFHEQALRQCGAPVLVGGAFFARLFAALRPSSRLARRALRARLRSS